MNTVRRLIFRTILNHVGMVALGFSALFFFIDFVEELQDLGEHHYGLLAALWTCVLLQGAHTYDLFPIALLIGSILALARMAQTSEFTILRTGGLGPGRALGLLGMLGVSAALVMVLIGNWYVPWSEQQLTLHKAQFSKRQGINLGRGGTWLREQRDLPGQTGRHVTVNVGIANNQGEFEQVRIFEFDSKGHLLRRLEAKQASVEPLDKANASKGSIWHLKGVIDTQWLSRDLLGEQAALQGKQIIEEHKVATLDWHSSLTPLVVSASVLPPETMSTAALWRYTQHLATNAQAAQRYEIEFW